MLTNTITTAALRTRDESPFVPPTGPASWPLPVSITGNENVFGFAPGTSSHDAAFMVIQPAPMVGADAGVAKQDRPPRWIPR
jgi:hypothetical protein